MVTIPLRVSRPAEFVRLVREGGFEFILAGPPASDVNARAVQAVENPLGVRSYHRFSILLSTPFRLSGDPAILPIISGEDELAFEPDRQRPCSSGYGTITCWWTAGLAAIYICSRCFLLDGLSGHEALRYLSAAQRHFGARFETCHSVDYET